MTMRTDTDRQQLNMILDQEITAAHQLAKALDSENSAISRRDLTALQQSIADKQAGMQRLEDLNRERTRLVESHGRSTDNDGMKNSMQEWDDTGMLVRKWRQLLTIAESCRSQNRINHQLVEVCSRHMHHALCILRGEDPDQNLYGPGGGNISRHSSRDLGTV